VPRDLQLNNNWNSLMSLCAKEEEYRANGRHPKLLRYVTEQIEQLGKELGFSTGQIRTRDFRAEKFGTYIVRVIKD
jgi:hypothetical protein